MLTTQDLQNIGDIVDQKLDLKLNPIDQIVVSHSKRLDVLEGKSGITSIYG